MHLPSPAANTNFAFNRVHHHAETPVGIQADLRVSKVRPRVVPVPYGFRPSICPVGAWQAWKEASDLTDPDGYVWRRLHTLAHHHGERAAARVHRRQRHRHPRR
jgi:hypothetical protein